MENSTHCFKRRKINEKIVNDIVHGTVKLPLHILEIVDTTLFQRLRWISQMGLNQFVYPTSTGSRFEHSIGTFNLASLLCKQIQNQIKEDRIDLQISETEIKCVEIAALCYNLGFGPYSQVWKDEIVPLLNIKSIDPTSLEQMSFEIFSDIVKNTDVVNYSPQRTTKLIEIIGLDDNEMDLINRIILGKYDPKKDMGKKFLFEIVSNKDTGLDVNTFDYLCRDTAYLGWSNKNKIHDIRRIMHFIRVIKTENNEWSLAIRDKEIFNVHELLYSRHMLHRYANQHKTVKAIDCMFKDAMKVIIENESHLKELIETIIPTRREDDNNNRDLKHVLYSKEFISKCCDFHIWNIMSKYTQQIVKNINERNLYRLYCQLKVENINKSGSLEKIKSLENKKPEELNKRIRMNENQERKDDENDDIRWDEIDICEDKEIFIKGLERIFQDLLSKNNIKNSIKITVSSFSLGGQHKDNPLRILPFYRGDQDDKSFTFSDKNYKMPDLTNLIFEEYIMMIFTEYEIESKRERNLLNDLIAEMCKEQDHKSQVVVLVDLKKNHKFIKN